MNKLPKRVQKETTWEDERGRQYHVAVTYEYLNYGGPDFPDFCRYEPIGVSIHAQGDALIDSLTLRRFPWGRITDECYPRAEVNVT